MPRPRFRQSRVAGERSPRALAYQSIITGLPLGIAVNLNGVSFDGCRQSDGVMLEAKGPGLAEFIDENGEWKSYFNGLPDLQDQIAKQSRVARASNRPVEWYVAEEPVAVTYANTRARMDSLISRCSTTRSPD